MSWARKAIRGVLLDLSGVLFDGDVVIEGSIDAVARLSAAGVPVRFCSNETSIPHQAVVDKLNKLGFSVRAEQVFTPGPCVRKVLIERGLRPFLLVTKEAEAEYSSVQQTEPLNCVVLSDAQDAFHYQNLNKALKVLIECDKPTLIALGRGKYYREKGELNLDVGAFAKVLEYASGVKAEVIGKPEPTYFNAALDDMKVAAEDALMIGDDLENDVGGAQAVGIRGVQVRTGKFMPRDEQNPNVTADGRVANLAEAVDVILAQWTS
ncbi:phospholysine phosphohistidine inorganic pyrophosphate phosphatase-like [Sycon ciliatum]|uniref:phospholysine phosphohistidine inorganic pyrophosphate phosphatase-like n=1 Tax=Sycon ciliatum TaxID=27933 RepID=UPI0020AAAD97